MVPSYAFVSCARTNALEGRRVASNRPVPPGGMAAETCSNLVREPSMDFLELHH
jgi:hypothetical protein